MQSLFLALVLAQGPPAVPSGPPAVPTPTYVNAYQSALESGKTFVVRVGGVRYTGPVGSVSVSVDRLAGYPEACVVIGTVHPDGYMQWSETLDERGHVIASAKVVSRAAGFFGRLRLRRGEVRHPVDDRFDPQLADMLSGMEPYQTATKTQTTFRRDIGYITPSPREAMPNKWNVPGHLDGIEGWSSKLYKTRGVKASVFLVRQDPRDSVSAVTWSRSYPDVEFVDVLRNADGKLFEVRIATKSAGKWERFVALSNPDARPHGYTRPTSQDCRACHHGVEQPGVSAYGGSAIPGADSVFSEPMDPVEYGGTVQGGSGTRL